MAVNKGLSLNLLIGKEVKVITEELDVQTSEEGLTRQINKFYVGHYLGSDGEMLYLGQAFEDGTGAVGAVIPKVRLISIELLSAVRDMDDPMMPSDNGPKTPTDLN